MSARKDLSWNDRFALIEHFKPTDNQICGAFDLTQDELDTARTCKDAGTFAPTADLEVDQYGNVFADIAAIAPEVKEGDKPAPSKKVVARPPKTTSTRVASVKAVKTEKEGTATVHTRPETATKKSVTTAATAKPQKRGRKGDKISNALQAVPEQPVPVDSFLKEHNVSLAVLRQSKRFIDKLEPDVQLKVGRVCVRQDKTTKTLMIWREELKQAS